MSNNIFAKEIYSKNFMSINENNSLSKSWSLFKAGKPPVLAVTNEKGKYVGIITRRCVVRSRLDHSTTKVKSLMRKAPRISPDFSLTKVARLMIESGIRQLPIFNKKRILGFITDENIIQATISSEWGNTLIEEIMTKFPHTIDENRSVGAVLNIIREHGISHIPITANGKLVGIISIQDIIDNLYQPKLHQTRGEIIGEKIPLLNIPAKGIMIAPVITISPQKNLKDAINKMHEYDISSVVITENEKIKGIVTKLDFLQSISQMEKKEKDFQIQFGIKDIFVSPYQKKILFDEFNSFINKYKEGLLSGTLFVYLKTHGQSHKGVPLIHFRLQLKTSRGAFYSSAEGYGIESTFRVALDKLDRRLLRSKELASDQKYARNYLQKIGFP
jgi:CBS domain-containing protein